MAPRTRRCLRDLLEHAAATDRLIDRGRAAFDSDEMLRFAAEDLLIRLGESVARIDRDDPTFVDSHPELELRRVKDARNLVAHGYDMVDSAIVWSILANNIPAVATRVDALLDSTH